MADASTTIEPQERAKQGLFRRLIRRVRGGAADAVETALREREERGDVIDGAQKDMILKAARFDTLRVEDVMQPRAAIVAVEANATLGETARIFSDSQHSRLPIYRETLDDPAGFVHVRDVMALLAPDETGAASAKFSDRLLPRIKRDILCVPQSMGLSTLFLKMQSSRIHLALVIDEYGGTHGLVSMEDLVEQIVGQIDDEHDEAANYIQTRAGAVEADGRADIAHLAAALGVASLDLPDHEDEFDTAAGMAMALAGRVPQRGEILHHPAGFDIEVIDADPRRVRRLRVKVALRAPTDSAKGDAGASSPDP
ncbi:MAG: transporter associated domain-containing protein [Hyphomonadaceae bacterium]|nr:transporter associated domain-containing protein [Hyphomonadaceae bacterium]